MLGASTYIIACTAKNRLLVRLRRLREPRYLIGAVVGVAYLYFSVFARWRSSTTVAARRRRRGAEGAADALAVMAGVAPPLMGGLMIVTALAWMLHSRAVSSISQSNSVSVYRAGVAAIAPAASALRSQIGILFGSLVAVLISANANHSRLQISVGVWLLLCTGRCFHRRRWRAHASGRRRPRDGWPASGGDHACRAGHRRRVGVASRRSLTRAGQAINRSHRDRIVTGLPRIVMFPFVSLALAAVRGWPGPFFCLVMAFLVLARPLGPAERRDV
jgi:hypothetical protein